MTTSSPPSPPPGVSPYRRTPEFTAGNTPAALLGDHATKADTWGRIVVLAGEVAYETAAIGGATMLDPATPGVIEPGVVHRVTPSPGARFYVEFLR